MQAFKLKSRQACKLMIFNYRIRHLRHLRHARHVMDPHDAGAALDPDCHGGRRAVHPLFGRWDIQDRDAQPRPGGGTLCDELEGGSQANAPAAAD